MLLSQPLSINFGRGFFLLVCKNILIYSTIYKRAFYLPFHLLVIFLNRKIQSLHNFESETVYTVFS